ncbi:hypothetical protein M446_5557 [Methylobacterium sp. 4-46]|uniref:hypothetical protein n=1 Tax=unclassified Methylobacterium TaxID=2615210 RepID=UPI000152D2AA|nr:MULTISPECIES: hypothetical protein [Methylobacterium]ACA19865.1 hypothetical protein M446_5557 [Methylobacterium sp. 4-46]WFT79048.1 hypothetical protein QA634_28010 [Methylobacterium nodulans]
MVAIISPPAWSLLTRSSINALLDRPGGSPPSAITIRPDPNSASLLDLPLIATTRMMLERAQVLGGLTLTATGALSRADTRAIFDAITWPGYDKADVLIMNKVLNEADVMPVEITRLTAQTAKLLRKREKRLLASKMGQILAREDQASELFRVLFATVFWRINLGYFDRVPVEAWPQNHIGLVLWCLSVAAQGWFVREDLMRTCTVWYPELDTGPTDYAGFAFESRVLRPLTWFGLMETRLAGDARQPSWRGDRQYRKAAQFEQVLQFDVQIDKPSGPAH